MDTNKPIHIKIDFNKSGDQFGSFSTTMTQEGKTVNMTGDCGTNAEMSYDLANGMAFAISNWETTDNWLWGNKCGGSCFGSAYLSFSNIKFTTGGDVPPPPVDKYDYGDACASKSDDFCDGSCDCRWSWPINDPAKWASKDAHCRCKA